MRKQYFPLFMMLLMLLSSIAHAAFPSEVVEQMNKRDNSTVLSQRHPIDEKLLKSLQKYLNAINTLQADFSESTVEGKVQQGVFYLQRPGKLRWQYHPPSPILLIINGDNASYYDYELDQMSHMKLDSSLLSVLTRKKIEFKGGDLIVEELTHIAGMIRLKLSYKGHPEHGKMTMIFQNKPMILTSLELMDELGNTTWVSFQNMKINNPIDKTLFVMKNTSTNARKSNILLKENF